MLYQEALNDAQEDIQAFGNFKSLTLSTGLRFISEAISEIQKRSRVIKKPLTILTTELDANGMIALDKSVTLPVRVTFTPTSGQPVEVRGKGPDEFAKMVRDSVPSWTIGPTGDIRLLYFTVEQNKIQFWPYQGLQGIYTLITHAKMPIYQPSYATDTTSYWYQWDATTIGAKMSTTAIPQEMDGAERAIVAYVAAKLLTMIPGWKQRFQGDYDERMAIFHGGAQDVIDNAPQYTENYEAKVNFGF